LLPPRSDRSKVPIVRVAPVVMVGLLGNVLLPARFGEVIRAYLFSRREGMAFGGAVGSTVLERILDTVTLAVMAFLAALAAGASGWILQGTGILAAVGIALSVGLAATGLTPILHLLDRIAALGPFHGPVGALARRLTAFAFWSGGAHRRGPIRFALLLSSVAWLTNAAVFLLIGEAVGLHLSAPGALLIMSVTVLATAIPSAPASVGTFELAAVAAALSLGLRADTALAMAVLAHAVGLLPTLVGGPLALGYIGSGGLRGLTGAALSEASLEGRAPEGIGQ
jgi:uncharacterized membrane protein YbhN (UPF0104 family)